MSEQKKTTVDNEEVEVIEEELGIYTLTDLETGEEENFELLAEATLDGETYMALAPVDNQSEEFVILKAVPAENGDTDLVDIEDDEEFDRVADYFEDLLFGDANYDEDPE